MSAETQLATRQLRLQHWAELIRTRLEQGIPVEEFCMQNGISQNQYFYWLRKVREAALEQSSHVQFAELSSREHELNIPQAPPKDPFVPSITIQIGNVIISASDSASTQLLRTAIEVMYHV